MKKYLVPFLCCAGLLIGGSSFASTSAISSDESRLDTSDSSKDKHINDTKRPCQKRCIAWDKNNNCTQWECN